MTLPDVAVPTFDELGLAEPVLRAITDVGYTTPTAIQAQAIPEVLKGRDVIGIAQTGTGKTASFVLPMLHALANGRARARMPRSLILSPTRELATQTADNFALYGKHLSLTMALLIGGVGMGDQEKALDRGVDVLIATPGRLLDWFERGKVMLNGVNILVIDEADRMLDMGFIPDVERILSLIASRRQTLLFSATMLPAVRRLADKFLNDPVQIEVARPATMAENVQAFIVPVGSHDKRQALLGLLRAEGIGKAIIFCNRKREVSSLNRFLQSRGVNARDIHGDLEQAQRQATLDAFKTESLDFLVATDVAARGLDVSDMPCVINYDVPFNPEDYVHRIGRTGRAGKTGRAFTFAGDADAKSIAAIERLTGKPAMRREVPDAEAPRPRAVAAEPPRERVEAVEAPSRPRVEADEPPRPSAEAAEPPRPRAARRRRTPAAAVSGTAPGIGPQPAIEAHDAEFEEAPAPLEPMIGTRRLTRRQPAEPRAVERRPAAAPASERPDTGQRGAAARRRPGYEQPEAPVVAFGDHIPSFLLQPVPLASLKKAG